MQKYARYLVLVVLGAIIGIFYWRVITTLQKDIAAAIVTASATVLVAVLSVVLSRYIERQRELEQEQHKQKAQVYEEFWSIYFSLAMEALVNAGTPLSPEQLKYETTSRPKLLIWASNEVILAYSAFSRSEAKQAQGRFTDKDRALGKMLVEMRTDLGHKKGVVSPEDLLTIFQEPLPQDADTQEENKDASSQVL